MRGNGIRVCGLKWKRVAESDLAVNNDIVYNADSYDTGRDLSGKQALLNALKHGRSSYDFSEKEAEGFKLEDMRRYDFVKVEEASGLKWRSMPHRPAKGRELTSKKLRDALARTAEFTEREWEAFGITDLRTDHFITSGSSYFQPSGGQGPFHYVLAEGHLKGMLTDGPEDKDPLLAQWKGRQCFQFSNLEKRAAGRLGRSQVARYTTSLQSLSAAFLVNESLTTIDLQGICLEPEDMKELGSSIFSNSGGSKVQNLACDVFIFGDAFGLAEGASVIARDLRGQPLACLLPDAYGLHPVAVRTNHSGHPSRFSPGPATLFAAVAANCKQLGSILLDSQVMRQGAPLGLVWEEIEEHSLPCGLEGRRELHSASLADALQESTRFTEAQLFAFHIHDLDVNDFIRVEWPKGRKLRGQPVASSCFVPVQEHDNMSQALREYDDAGISSVTKAMACSTSIGAASLLGNRLRRDQANALLATSKGQLAN
eukprot:690676-Prymnesium_polylepis.1